MRECVRQLSFGLCERRHDDLRQQCRARDWQFLVFESAGRAQNVVGRDVLVLAAEVVAAARSAPAFENAGSHQGLQHGFEVSRRQAEPLCQRFGGNRLVSRMCRDVDHRRDSKDTFARQERHGYALTTLVSDEQL